VNYGVVKWVDPVHPDILKNCLLKLWEMFHEQNLGRIQDKNAYDAEVAKLMKEKDHLYDEYHKMVDDVTKMFDWQDGVARWTTRKQWMLRNLRRRKS
jgi:hypothetical protein